MLVRKFIQWSQGASATARADGVAALARAYLYSEMSAEERRETESALYALLDDPSPLPRRAMAECFAGAPDAPLALIHGLARDQSEVSAVVLTRSPLLADADLIDCAVVGDSAAQAAIALRAELSPAVCASLAEIAGREAAIALAVNESANIPDFALRRMVERFGDDGEVREALLGRAWLPATVRAHLADATARALAAFVVSRQWLSAPRSERIARDNRDRATMIIASGCADYSEETAALAAYLRVAGQITPGVALRALLCGQKGLFEATLAELTGLSARRIAGVVREPWSDGFAAVYAKAGFPAGLLIVFRSALAALARLKSGHEEEGALRLPLIQAVLADCAGADPALANVTSLLRRFELDATRDEARRRVAQVTAQVNGEMDNRESVQERTAQTRSRAAEDSPLLFGLPTTLTPRLEGPEADTGVLVDLAALERELLAA
ncbi:uncharacterized protein (DUF2336 family) [Rhodoblastus acidophilus]|uniref:DUF2336 domain-containing protein n=1 Tax=Rhodoblastus acidophilus TaxID=1074 RepID=UPI002224686B|nr:DUF2336 domain-containing protein [Rhodoblastus acidophilus]MCW2285000.1 uncharacterized protein (DUF2336 family) [Rhodoblastus acidophilus]MCW2333936.1 uncharacterized protein (DUF2336 family) [Rhodoblastus acidophilus]